MNSLLWPDANTHPLAAHTCGKQHRHLNWEGSPLLKILLKMQPQQRFRRRVPHISSIEMWDSQDAHLTQARRARTASNRSGTAMGRAAEALGLERSHLYRKMKALGIHLGE